MCPPQEDAPLTPLSYEPRHIPMAEVRSPLFSYEPDDDPQWEKKVITIQALLSVICLLVPLCGIVLRLWPMVSLCWIFNPIVGTLFGAIASRRHAGNPWASRLGAIGFWANIFAIAVWGIAVVLTF